MSETSIPNIIHFVLINDEFTGPFSFYHYLAIYSAYLINKPDTIYFYHNAIPYGPHWENLLEIPSLITEEVDIPTHIGEKPLLNYAHKADILRLEKLNERGGVYMDMDTITVKPYAPYLNNQMLMGRQQNYAGLCNAIIMTTPKSEFLTIWRAHYEEHFKPKGWNESSIRLPYILAQKYPHLITVKPPAHFFLPNWNETKKIFAEPTPLHPDLTTLHLWQSQSKEYLKPLDNFTSVFNSQTQPPTLFQTIVKNLVQSHGLLYVRSPKTASTSIAELLKEHFPKPLEIHDSTKITMLSQIPNTTPIIVASVFYMKYKHELIQLYGKRITFGIVRDPYTKATSAWKYCKAIKNKPLLNALTAPPKPRRHDNHDWIHFTRLQTEGLFHPPTDTTPIYYPSVDLLFKFEELHKLTEFLKYIYNKDFVLKYHNRTKHKTDQITINEQKAIETLYAKDFELLPYKQKPSRALNVKIKVISFCLYGSKATYILGMEENIKLADEHFKDWVVHIYYNNTVPQKYITKYQEMGAETILCENVGENKHNWEGMFWRFFPLNDPTVHAWLSRDADSRLSAREASLVNDWLASNKSFHIIRDHRCHMHFIMGGLFGINNTEFHAKHKGKLKPIKEIIDLNYRYYKERNYNVDQLFLNNSVWPLIENDHMAHRCPKGRKVKDLDIEIEAVNDFVGKQYRLKDELTQEPIPLPPQPTEEAVIDKPVHIVSEKSGLYLELITIEENPILSPKPHNPTLHPPTPDRQPTPPAFHSAKTPPNTPTTPQTIPTFRYEFKLNKPTNKLNQLWTLTKDGYLQTMDQLSGSNAVPNTNVCVEHFEKIRGTLSLCKELDKHPTFQTWKVTPENYLYNRHANLVMDVKGGSTNPGSEVRIHKLNGSTAQKWRLVVSQTTPDPHEDPLSPKSPNLPPPPPTLSPRHFDRTINNQFDKIYIVHLARLTDRKKLIEHQIQKFKIDPNKIVIIDAVDKHSLNPEQLKQEQKWAYPGNTFWCKDTIINDRGDKCWCEGKGHPLNRGQFACQLSHIKVYEHIVKHGTQRSLVLEDDFFFKDDLHEQINTYFRFVPQNWELLYLCQSFYKSQRKHNININNPYFIKRKRGCQYTTMYAIKLNAATDLFNDAFPMRAAADGYLSSLVDRSYKIKNAYITMEDFCKNGSKQKDNGIHSTI